MSFEFRMDWEGVGVMPNFCVKCGAPLSGGPFCVKCGADARSVVPSVQPQSPPNVPQPPSPRPALETSTPASAKQGMSSLAKLGIAALAVILVGCAAGVVGVYYVAGIKSARNTTRYRTKFSDQVPARAAIPKTAQPRPDRKIQVRLTRHWAMSAAS